MSLPKGYYLFLLQPPTVNFPRTGHKNTPYYQGFHTSYITFYLVSGGKFVSNLSTKTLTSAIALMSTTSSGDNFISPVRYFQTSGLVQVTSNPITWKFSFTSGGYSEKLVRVTLIAIPLYIN